MFTTYAIIAAISYLLGSIPFGYILVRVFLKQDIRATGSGNIGATNVGRTGRKGLAITTLILDALKGALAVVIAYAVTPESAGNFHFRGGPGHPVNMVLAVYALAALFAILGHLFPVWLKFKGGKGVATGAGAFLVLAPKAVLIVLAVFALLVAIFRYVSLGSIIATALFPVVFYFLRESPNLPLATLIVAIASLLIIVKHHANIGRLLKGTESKLGAKPVPPPQHLEKQA